MPSKKQTVEKTHEEIAFELNEQVANFFGSTIIRPLPHATPQSNIVTQQAKKGPAPSPPQMQQQTQQAPLVAKSQQKPVPRPKIVHQQQPTPQPTTVHQKHVRRPQPSPPSGDAAAKTAHPQQQTVATVPQARAAKAHEPKTRAFVPYKPGDSPVATSYQVWNNNWTFNSIGSSVTLNHPLKNKNDGKMEERIGNGGVIDLRFDIADVHRFEHPNTRKGLTADQIMVENGIRLKTASDVMWHAGNLAGRKFGVFDSKDVVVKGRVDCPPGTAVLVPLPSEYGKFDRAAALVEEMFRREDEKPSIGFNFPSFVSAKKTDIPQKAFAPQNDRQPDKNFLGYNAEKAGMNGGKNYAPTLADIFSYLDEELADFLMEYLKGLAMKIGCSFDAIPLMTIIFIGYNPGHGFKHHIDGITDFGNYPGFIFNLTLAVLEHAAQEEPKYMDLIDLSTSENLNAVRFELRHRMTHVMSGQARISYTHSIESGGHTKKFTIATKCPHLALQYKHAWIKESRITFGEIEFNALIQYIDSKAGLAAQAKHRTIRDTTPGAKC